MTFENIMKKIKLALVGYGNMGREIEDLVKESQDLEIVSVSYKKITDKLDKTGIRKADIAIDFTSPHIVVNNIREVASLGKNMVVGTTGWYGSLKEVQDLIKKAKTGFIYASNFSVGANIFFKLLEKTGKLFNNFTDYDVYGFEVHHKGKVDSPSGTAKKLADIVVKNVKRKNKIETARLDRKILPNEMHFASVRGGYNAGYHEVVFDSIADEIKLSHQARGRRGFAEGALMAARFISGKKGFYNFEDLFKS